MAALVFKDAFFEIDNSGGTPVDLSSQVRSITLNYSKELLDASAMGVGATRERVAGLLDWSIDVEFNQDYAAASVDDTLFPLVAKETAGTVTVRPVNTGGVSATNPNFTGECYLENYQPAAGGVATVATVSATFQGTGTLSRATS